MDGGVRGRKKKKRVGGFISILKLFRVKFKHRHLARQADRCIY